MNIIQQLNTLDCNLVEIKYKREETIESARKIIYPILCNFCIEVRHDLGLENNNNVIDDALLKFIENKIIEKLREEYK